MGMARKTAGSGLGTVFFGPGSFTVRYLPTALSAGQTYEDAEKVERRERDKIK